MMSTIAVVGLGQIGSSIGAAVRKRRLARRIVGVERRADVRKKAVGIRAVHEASARLEAVAAADVIFLAVPVRQILLLIPRVAGMMKPGALLTDVGSTKEEILRLAARVRRDRKGLLPFIGGHPMAGTERAGPVGCDADLFVGRPYALVPTPACPHRDLLAMKRLVRGIGARPVLMDSAREHDRAVAVISHLPHLLAYALLEFAGKKELAGLAGGSFRDATRVARSSPEMVLDFLLTNRRELPAAVRGFQKALRGLSRKVSEGNREALRGVLDRSRSLRGRLPR